MPDAQVIILGAGAAGLMAATILSANGRSVLILEARGRLGGRVHTITDPAFGMPVELGAEFIHGRPESTWRLVREAGLCAYDVPFEHRQRRRGNLVRLPNFSDELNKVMGGLSRIGSRDISFAKYLKTHARDRSLADARRMALAFVEGFDAADPQRISSKSLAQEQQGLGDVGGEMQFRLLDGYGAIIAHLHRSLDRKRVKIQLNSPAREVCWKKHKVQVRCETSRSTRSYSAEKILVTLPIGVLQIPPDAPAAIQFAPDLPEKRHAAMRLGAGPVVKAVLKFRQPFWEENSAATKARADDGLKDTAFMHDPNLAFPTFWTARPLRLPVLTAWAGGPKALALSGQTDGAIVGAAIDSLSKLLGQSRSRLCSMLERSYAYDWPADAFARGAYSYQTVGASGARTQLASTIEHTIFFAGEATDTSGQASTVAGALSSGERAAREILGKS